MVSSLSPEVPWISGYLEFTNDGGGQQPAMTFSPSFHVGLTQVQRISDFPMWYSGVQAWSTESYYIADYLADVNYAIANGPSVSQRWAGSKPFDVKVFQATVGLVGFAAFVQVCVWLAMVMLSYDAPGVASNALVGPFTKFGSLTSAFIALVAVINFSASGYQAEFCKAFDPDATTNGKGCGAGDGLNLAVFAAVLSLLHTVIMFRYVPDHVARQYSFAGGASGAEAKMAGGSDYKAIAAAGGSGGDGGSSSISFQNSTAL